MTVSTETVRMAKSRPGKNQSERTDFPCHIINIQNCARCEKDLKDNKYNSLHLERKYDRIFVLEHCLFLVAHIMSADKYPGMFPHQMEAIVY